MDGAGTGDGHPFERLTPDFILAAVESRGHRCDGRLLALNSYENRVYQVGREDAEPLIAKFYRPGRWSDAAIAEEHAFVVELAAQDLPVVAPLAQPGGATLSDYDGFRLALYARRGGRAPELDRRDNLVIMGRYLARMHTVGRGRPFNARETITVAGFGAASVSYLAAHWIPSDLRDAYTSITRDLLARLVVDQHR
ncbi:MAG: serine/threonine protein kinase, partial [Gammaproteobacteria bacterium]